MFAGRDTTSRTFQFDIAVFVANIIDGGVVFAFGRVHVAVVHKIQATPTILYVRQFGGGPHTKLSCNNKA